VNNMKAPGRNRGAFFLTYRTHHLYSPLTLSYSLLQHFRNFSINSAAAARKANRRLLM